LEEVVLERVSKVYRSVRAMDDVSFEVSRGSIFAIIAPLAVERQLLLG
jgi:ABC-type multidrug transport system ATPase subunit